MFLQKYGITPLLVPNALENPVEYVRTMGANALLITGGGDVSAQEGETFQLSGEQAILEGKRDKTEQALLAWAFKAKVPVLGVCRGMHAANVFAGGSLCRDLNRTHVGCPHEITLHAHLKAARNAQTITVNSYHNTGIFEQNLAPELKVTATSADGLVEAFTHTKFPLTAIQWHPERPGSDALADKIIIQDWINAAGRLEHL